MHTTWIATVKISVAVLAMIPFTAYAKMTAADLCAAKKLKAESVHVKSRMNCETNKGLGEAPDANCVQEASEKLAGSFDRASAPGGCGAASPPADVVGAKDEIVVQAVVNALKPPAGSSAPTDEITCAVKKAKTAVGQNTRGIGCIKRDITRQDDLELESCLLEDGAKTEDAFARTEDQLECATTGDAPVVSETIDTHLREVKDLLLPPTPGRFADNGDGTITDNQTGLMWEKKDYEGGIHAYLSTYSWSDVLSPSQPTGTVHLTFLATLNAAPCFAGHCDWRLPTIAEWIDVYPWDTTFNDGRCARECEVTTCSCTNLLEPYWSADSSVDDANYAYAFDGTSVVTEKINERVARAVRP